MSRLMGQVLDVLKIESPIGLGIAMAKLDLTDVLTDVVDEARDGYPDIAFHLSIIGDGDAHCPAQVVSNLLGNARARPAWRAEHGYTGGSGELGGPRRQRRGCQLGDDAVHQLYTLFKQASQAQRRNRGGMELGLYIVDRILAGHDGTIAYGSVALSMIPKI